MGLPQLWEATVGKQYQMQGLNKIVPYPYEMAAIFLLPKTPVQDKCNLHKYANQTVKKNRSQFNRKNYKVS